jgi:Kdo2-lipid IVA lauroyltransferase/acyltransferase
MTLAKRIELRPLPMQNLTRPRRDMSPGVREPRAQTPASARADLREGGTWSTWQAHKNTIIFTFVRTALWACSLLPTAWIRALGQIAGVAAHACLPRLRQQTRRHIALGMPELAAPERDALAKRNLSRLGRTFAEMILSVLERRPPIPTFAAGHAERLHQALTHGRGVILISAHLGNWEAVARAIVAAGVPLVAVGREPYDPRLMPLYARSRAGIPMIYRGATTAPIQMIRVLRSGRVLGIPMDLNARVKSVEAPFLAYKAATPVGPATLALRTGAIIAVVTLTRDANALGGDGASAAEAITCTLIDHAHMTPGRESELALTTRINAELSLRIRTMPDGWLWPHARR